jgi:hypothetical protein
MVAPALPEVASEVAPWTFVQQAVLPIPLTVVIAVTIVRDGCRIGRG